MRSSKYRCHGLLVVVAEFQPCVTGNPVHTYSLMLPPASASLAGVHGCVSISSLWSSAFTEPDRVLQLDARPRSRQIGSPPVPDRVPPILKHTEAEVNGLLPVSDMAVNDSAHQTPVKSRAAPASSSDSSSVVRSNGVTEKPLGNQISVGKTGAEARENTDALSMQEPSTPRSAVERGKLPSSQLDDTASKYKGAITAAEE